MRSSLRPPGRFRCAQRSSASPPLPIRLASGSSRSSWFFDIKEEMKITILSLAVAAGAASAQQPTAPGEWRTYGGDKAFTRYSPLAQIDRDNVSKLRVAWTRPAVDPLIKDKIPGLNVPNYFRGTPIMINGVLYAPNGVGLLEAFDAATGRTRWVQQPVEPTLKEAAGQSTRGVAYWRKNEQERLISIRGEYLYSIDLKTGLPDRGFGDNGPTLLNRTHPDSAA